MNRTQSVQSILQSSNLFRGLEPAHLQALAEAAAPLHLAAATHLLMPGATPSLVYLVTRGWVKLYRLNESGEETTTCLCGPGDIVLADLLFYPHPASVGAQAESEVSLVMVPADILRRVQSLSPRFNLNLLQTLAEQSQRLMHQVEQLKTAPAVERIAGFLLRTMLDESGQPHAESELPFEKAKIADYLGLTPETFSRTLKELAARGITVRGRKVMLEDLRGLCANCDPVLAPRCTHAGSHSSCRGTLIAGG